MKKMRLFTIWLLPLIVIGGLLYPILGYLALTMMVFLIGLSFFKGRFWCWNICPRGSFLDIVLSKFSRKKIAPKIFINQWFRWTIFAVFMSFFIFRISKANGDIIAIGGVFVSMCLITTIIAIFMGIPLKQRAWCMICPMGTLQEKLKKKV